PRQARAAIPFLEVAKDRGRRRAEQPEVSLPPNPRIESRDSIATRHVTSPYSSTTRTRRATALQRVRGKSARPHSERCACGNTDRDSRACSVSPCRERWRYLEPPDNRLPG